MMEKKYHFYLLQAKYRVVNSEDDKFNTQHGPLYFCSKCTIPLVQQGFIVEEITKQLSRESLQNSEGARYNDYRQRLENKRKKIECGIMEINDRYEQEMFVLDQYYENIFNFLQRQKENNRRQIEAYYRNVLFCLVQKK